MPFTSTSSPKTMLICAPNCANLSHISTIILSSCCPIFPTISLSSISTACHFRRITRKLSKNHMCPSAIFNSLKSKISSPSSGKNCWGSPGLEIITSVKLGKSAVTRKVCTSTTSKPWKWELCLWWTCLLSKIGITWNRQFFAMWAIIAPWKKIKS